MVRMILDIDDRRPAWAMPSWVVEEITAAAPADWTVVSLSSNVEGTGDGSVAASPEVLAAVRDAHIYVGYGIAPDILRVGRGLRWVHSGSAGIARSLTAEMLASPVIFTNSAGIHGPPMAEAVVAMLLYFARGFDIAVHAAAERRWAAARFYAGEVAFPEIADTVVGIFGFGGIGREVAARVRALGARVIGCKRREPQAGVEVVTGAAGLRHLLAHSDALVVTAPDTPATRGIIGAEALAQMRPGAVVVNVARGAIIDEQALYAALASGHLRGAALDVFAEEPLPAAHPLWTLPNVLITPHVSPLSSRFWRRQTDLIVDNMRRFSRGEPLRNMVDKVAGY